MKSKEYWIDVAVIFTAFTPHTILIALIISDGHFSSGINDFKDFLEFLYYIAAIFAVALAGSELNNWRRLKKYDAEERFLLDAANEALNIKNTHIEAKNFIDKNKERIKNLADESDTKNSSKKSYFLALELSTQKEISKLFYSNLNSRHLISSRPENKHIIASLNRATDVVNAMIELASAISVGGHVYLNFLQRRGANIEDADPLSLKGCVIPIDFNDRYKSMENIDSIIDDFENRKLSLLEEIN